MHKPSPAQKAYLARQKRDRRLVVSARLLVFLIFLAQWEILARAGWIDSFIFSSPSMIFKTFMEMAQNHSLFIHIGATLKKLFLVSSRSSPGSWHFHSAVGMPQTCKSTGALSGSAEQPS
ncbi:MAG: hypothetical protein ACLT4D_09395 [Blautia faecis]